MSCAKTTEPIEVLFVIWIFFRLDLCNSVIDTI